MAPSVSFCTVCNDDDEDVVYNCKGKGGACSYQLCAGCVRFAFDDKSGANSSFCALCEHPCALDMISAVCGKGAILAVEQNVRGRVEFQVHEEFLRKEASRSVAVDMSEQARKIFNELSERLNLKCPRCKAVFNDYDGCDALTCAVPSCRAAFCAICLEDCGHDAHAHVATHGSLFGKAGFEKSKILRAKSEIDKLMASLSHEPFELKQLVHNHIEKAHLLKDYSAPSTPGVSTKKSAFLSMAKATLSLAVRTDRLAVLSNPSEYDTRKQINAGMISPRCAVPSDYRLQLIWMDENLYRIELAHKDIATDHFIVIHDIKDHFKENAKVESLLNVAQALRCAVIAIEGRSSLYQSSRGGSIPNGHRIAYNEVGITLQAIDKDGNAVHGEMFRRDLTIIGLNQNNRMLLQEKHVESSSDSELMIEPLEHLIGVGVPKAVITELEMEVPVSQSELNDDQKKVAHPLLLKTAMEVAGPPGTGKTKTIVELVRGLLKCTNFDILVLSERNGAINAIAEKFKKESLKSQGKKTEITDLHVWMSVMAYGVAESMGESTKLFTVEEKLQCHPEMIDLQEKRDMLDAASKSLSKALRRELSDIVQSFGRRFNEDSAVIKSREIERNTIEFSSPLSIIGATKQATLDISTLLDDKIYGSKYVSEESTSDVVVRHSLLLGRLIPIRTDKERADHKSEPWDAKEATKRLRFIIDRLTAALKLLIFDPDNATCIYKEKTDADEAFKALRARLEEELPDKARLHMSTIGSSHKLQTMSKNNRSEDLVHSFGHLSLDDSDEDEEFHPPKDTICIFDESGCIPAYELLGLSRLGRSINSIILVGDKHQLPPYDPMQGRHHAHGKRNGQSVKTTKIHSLLDASALTIDTGKVMLTLQYRVPRDIAEMLNSRVYRGQYRTCPTAKVPDSGLKMINVPWSESPQRKYVNPNEIDMGINLLMQLKREYDISSTLVITPYKNQQREFEFQIKRNNERGRDYIETTVLTIDQCQGQEADAVILSFVRRPTRFLTINRLNVALSRSCKKIFVLTDFKDFKRASSENNWECSGLASDMLVDFI